MKIAFLGKGGSGKSTLAAALVTSLRAKGWRVLAVDADHNMDLSYNLGIEPGVFLGTDPDAIKEYVGASRTDSYKDALALAERNNIAFAIEPPDGFTADISIPVAAGVRLIIAGPHTGRVRSGEACSHSLAAPLKVYLPRLQLNENEAVVIDERAGTDPVATGILASVDLGVIVREPTSNSVRVAEQIRNELELSGIPYIVVDNKVRSLDEDKETAVTAILHRLGMER